MPFFSLLAAARSPLSTMSSCACVTPSSVSFLSPSFVKLLRSVCSFCSGAIALAPRFSGLVAGAPSIGGSSCGVWPLGVGGGVFSMSEKVVTTAFLSPCTTDITSAPMCWPFMSRLKLSASSMFFGMLVASDCCNCCLPLFSSVTGTGFMSTMPTWPALLLDCSSETGITTAASVCWRFSAASSCVCSFCRSRCSTALPRAITGAALAVR